jgi:excisionase family DNA binding protein
LSSLAPDVVEAIDQLIAERVRAELEGMAAGNGSPWLALDEAAAYLRVSERTLERMIARSRVRSSTVGRRRLVHRDELDALVRAATGEDVAPTTPSRHREA